MLVVSNRFNVPSASNAAGILRRQPLAVSTVKNGPIPGGFVAKLRVSPPPRPSLDTRHSTIRP
ncbi:hypothetical protein C5615_26070 [Burkholderia cepacia]|uniref:Uncharacterized protein n=1 Tax=Burkholderia cepacia TaxID=292 RepID=A0A2S8III6_BURCE|nr:hypothetical protein C5615_26070 [Burkholderia cepacia]